MCSEVVKVAREASEKLKGGRRRKWSGKKSKLSPLEEVKILGACTAAKLAFYTNHHYDFLGNPVIYKITPDSVEDYIEGLIIKTPSFHWSKISEKDTSHFMSCEWDGNIVDTLMSPVLKKTPRWKDLPSYIKPFFFEAAIRTRFKDWRIVNIDARWKPNLLPVLKAAEKPASLLLNRIRDAAKRQVGYAPELYLVMEMLPREDRSVSLKDDEDYSPHPHFTLALRPETTNEQIKECLKSALGNNKHVETQFWLNPAYVNRGTYITKQAAYTAYHMSKCGFASKQFFAATNRVRDRAREICNAELHETARHGSASHDPRERLLSALLRYDEKKARAILRDIK